MKKIFKYWNTLSPITQKIFCVLSCILVINILIIIVFFMTTPITIKSLRNLEKVSVLYHALGFFFYPHDRSDSWMPMFEALKHLQNQHHNLVYSEVFFIKKIKFQYPLTSLLPVALVRNFLSESATKQLMNFLLWLGVLFTIITSIKVFNSTLSNIQKPVFNKDLIARNIFLFCLGITFYPVVKANSLGQVQGFINFFFTLAVWFWLRNKFCVSGLLVGLMILIKPQYTIILVWGLLRKKWDFLATASAIVITGLIASIFTFGLSENLDYLNVLKFISQHGEAFYANQSMNGLLNRLLFNGSNLEFDLYSFPEFNPIVYYGTILSSLLLISLGLLGFVYSNKQGSTFDFMNIVLVCTIASPVAWEHHYGVLLVIYSYLIPFLLTERKNLVFLCTVSYFVASNLLSITNTFSSIPVLNILQSYLFFAALTILLILNRKAQYKSSQI